MYFALFSFLSSCVVDVAISLCTSPPAPSHLVKTTYWTLKDCAADEVEKQESKNALYGKFECSTFDVVLVMRSYINNLSINFHV